MALRRASAHSGCETRRMVTFFLACAKEDRRRCGARKKRYNQRHDMREKRTRFNPDFWEIPVDHITLQRLADRRSMTADPAEDADRQARQRKIAAITSQLREMIPAALTPRQREIVELYFFQGQTEQEIAEQLRISVPSVSQHLFGKKRRGKRIGGAMARLRKEAERRQIVWAS